MRSDRNATQLFSPFFRSQLKTGQVLFFPIHGTVRSVQSGRTPLPVAGSGDVSCSRDATAVALRTSSIRRYTDLFNFSAQRDIDPEKVSGTKLLCIKAWAFLWHALEEIYAAGRYVFYNDAKVEELFYMDYWQKISAKQNKSVLTPQENPTEETSTTMAEETRQHNRFLGHPPRMAFSICFQTAAIALIKIPIFSINSLDPRPAYYTPG